MSKLADVLNLYLYDLEVSDHWFRRAVAEAMEDDKLALIALLPPADLAAPGCRRLSDALHSVKV